MRALTVLYNVLFISTVCSLVKAECRGDKCSNVICGSDGANYYSWSEFEEALSKTPDLVILGRGSCNVRFTEACDCCLSREVKVVCGSDNQKYQNKCYLECVKKSNYGLLVDLKEVACDEGPEPTPEPEPIPEPETKS